MSKPKRQVSLEVALLDAARIIEGLAPKNRYYEAKVRELRAIADGGESSLERMTRRLLK